MSLARMWQYPEDSPLEAPRNVSFERQAIVIAANPGDEEFPWAVILQDRITMFDIKNLSFEGEATGVTDWTADNYWYPKMWIEIIGFLEISGTSAKIHSKNKLLKPYAEAEIDHFRSHK